MTDNQISDIVKSEILETLASTSHTHFEFVDCGETIKEEIKEEKIHSSETNSKLQLESSSNSFDILSDFGNTRKEELDDQHPRYHIPHVVTSLDEPVTCAEFFV